MTTNYINGVGGGKSQTVASIFAFDLYVAMVAYDLSMYKRLPRKLKKKYKKQSAVWSSYLSRKHNER